MTDRPILFSAPMVRALLDGRKTQTRRVLKGAWQAALEGHDRVKTWFAPPDVPREGIPNQWAQSGIWAEKHGPRGYNRPLGFAPYRPGDRLWARETWSHTGDGVWSVSSARLCGRGGVVYRADSDPLGSGWFPAIHMPREFSRLTLTVTEVRVQRLQDISEEDARAEGVDRDSDGWRDYLMPSTQCCPSAAHSFRTLWTSIHGPGSWDKNPWIAALTFTVARRNIDA